jgi:hypothetical protein
LTVGQYRWTLLGSLCNSFTNHRPPSRIYVTGDKGQTNIL